MSTSAKLKSSMNNSYREVPDMTMRQEREKVTVVYDDPITNPPHYNSNTMETIDLIRGSMAPTEYEGYLKGNIFKYVSRYRYKEKENPKKDLLKAQWYLNKLILEMTNDRE